MDEAPIVDALERIEAALARLDVAARGIGATAAQDAALRRRHEALKASVAGSLAELDAVIAGRGRQG